MTIKELVEELKKYSEDMKVYYDYDVGYDELLVEKVELTVIFPNGVLLS